MAATPLTATYLSEAISVDNCLDAGGSYDYVLAACDQNVNHRYVAFAERWPMLLMVTLVAVVVAGSLTAIFSDGLSSRRRTSR